ncbi:gamma-glutamyl-gamma-aminobutyrate hydrolase family protein [Halomonas litopenaei]|uniref:gamma-glutamyl-gamma-aminobutyrate hydrolase family protein n=1 Tax=Halomonas litopenaei TaxID=2109328 RepID=UPI001A8D0A69|nr:gamma-glutamyl-gamma-aminobutyrate hydrolase family protein [Halomonas litopenaei]MBN8413537.1 gamma-glutamyl-gamma-aminobutyrate hydrolase family protein [Halomonas litopenaei]
MNIRPLVGVIACRRDVEGHPAHMVTDKYVRTLRDYGLEPVVLPVWEEQRDEDVSALLARLDGLLLTGSYTNVLPERYGAQRAPENTRDDVARDAAAMSWIPLALERSLPLLGICRGFQEINVAFGGSLHQAVQRVPGMLDHREPEGHKQQQYAPVHDVTIEPGGQLAALFDEPVAKVNSLHQQGVDRLGEGLRVEALAPDGLVEAVSVAQAPGFTLAVQWHPEWESASHPLYDAIFRGFAKACASRR